MKTAKKILYISYDGMTDPLGQSQVLPYLAGLSQQGYEFTILSFEKKDRFQKNGIAIFKLTKENGINWLPMSFTNNPPLLSKAYDVIRMRRKALKIYRKEKFDMVHCRGYMTADIGLFLKRKFGVKFFFDMRGFWADEKKDAGAWDQNSFLFRKVYKYYKKKETEFIQNADYIISLTEAGKKEIMKWSSYNPDVPVNVIPCCADMDHFSLTTLQDKLKGRQLLGLPENGLIISYLGSVGAWYMLDEMLDLFMIIKKTYPQATFLFVTHSDHDFIIQKIIRKGFQKSDFKIVEAEREQVPLFIKASDINVSFIKPVYSKISSSPTKLGEVTSMGIPVIANSGVGDVKEMIEQSQSGMVIDAFTEKEYLRVVNAIPCLLKKNALEIRNNVYPIYDLRQGIKKYLDAYKTVFSGIG